MSCAGKTERKQTLLTVSDNPVNHVIESAGHGQGADAQHIERWMPIKTICRNTDRTTENQVFSVMNMEAKMCPNHTRIHGCSLLQRVDDRNREGLNT